LALIAQKRIDVVSLVTHRFGLDGLEEALNLVHERRDGVVKAMIVM
jgi:threonine dehydrogenase-like Zn-dependent dehydrogenase